MRVNHWVVVGTFISFSLFIFTFFIFRKKLSSSVLPFFGETLGEVSNPESSDKKSKKPHKSNREIKLKQQALTDQIKLKKTGSHTVVATTYWIGEDASAENDHISNVPSAWDKNTVSTFGGVDNGSKRSFKPKHNTYYFALPAAEFDSTGSIGFARQKSPWVNEISLLSDNESLFKGRWIKITSGDKTIFAQWHDVGPNEEQDYNYVFGTKKPKNTFGEKAGLDLSPDASKALGINGSKTVTWKFVPYSSVKSGPWKKYPFIDNKIRW